MGIVSTRVSEKMEDDIKEFAKDEKLEQTSEAIRKLLALATEEWKKKRALELLQKGHITFSKAAELAGISVWELADLIKKEGVVWVRDVEGLKKDIARALK
ncbi:MAG: UPF0175 family protein [Candidatus Woesearchaeota archaeon]|jgi:predicted HTH domain antitoxin|nr:UPF0175 family protein [Candidatus Woesearchaeota archaeon]MDP7457285.1 UPF0175 family protein [Candidatus Woesearchaeota archaeon]